MSKRSGYLSDGTTWGYRLRCCCGWLAESPSNDQANADMAEHRKTCERWGARAG